MSWGVQASGQLEAVKAEIEKQFETIISGKWITDVEELAHLSDVRAFIAKVLGHYEPNTGVQVSASGSFMSGAGTPKQHSHSLNITPIYNWVEKRLP